VQPDPNIHYFKYSYQILIILIVDVLGISAPAENTAIQGIL